LSADLRRKPLGITVMGRPIVLFRDRAGCPRALLDRCSHRNLALSLGRVGVDGCIECAYHGWRFDGEGRSVEVPGLLGPTGDPAGARDVATFAAMEQDGFVWVWAEPASEPDRIPFRLPTLTGGGSQVVLARDLDCSLHAALENALDVPHTAHVHGGLFRGRDSSEITAVRRDVPGGTEVQYLGEPVRFGRLRLSRSDLTFDHWDRFFLPSIAQIEYRVSGWLRLVNTIVHLPLSPFRTRAWFVVRFWSTLPTSVVRPIIAAQGRRILRQDAVVLARQTENIQRFGLTRYASTDLDIMGSAIWRLLLESERTESAEHPSQEDDGGEDSPPRRSITFRA
jgi:phenylpropionate dioxygenase-like ring-hydroxylating dioxygenase large terminal subunit